MSDVRALMADALRQHYFWWPNHSSIGSEAHCQCGARPRDWSYWADHFAAALLSLPDIAIVDLPEPSYVDEPEAGLKGYGFNGGPSESHIASERGVYAHDGLIYDQWDGLTPAEARIVASWWLAAAKAAEDNS